MKIELITLLVDDLDACLAFYHDVLGLDVRALSGDYVELDHAGTRLALYPRAALAAVTQRAEDAAPRAGQVVELAMRVDNAAAVDRAFADAVAHGAPAVSQPRTLPWGQRAAFIADPDGNLIEFYADMST